MRSTNVCGIDMPEGLLVVVDVLSIHFDKELWGPVDPNRFWPERFATNRAPCAFLGFGYGPRNCIGMKFAMTEMKMSLLKMLRKFEIVSTEGTPREYKYQEGIVRSMIDPVNVILRRREN